jgi:hypothetical protein
MKQSWKNFLKKYNMENEDFIPYEEALPLKELGFDEPCFGKFYHNHLEIGGSWLNSEFNKDKKDGHIFTSAPLYQQAFRWFREKYNLYFDHTKLTTDIWDFEITNMKLDKIVGCVYGKTYEEAELACLRKLIEIVKDVNN